MWLLTDSAGNPIGESAVFICGVVFLAPLSRDGNQLFDSTLFVSWDAFVEWADSQNYIYRPVTQAIAYLKHT